MQGTTALSLLLVLALAASATGCAVKDVTPEPSSTTPATAGDSPTATVNPGPLVTYTLRAAADAFGDADADVLARNQLSGDLPALADALAQRVSADFDAAQLAETWGVTLHQSPYEAVVAGWWADEHGDVRAMAIRSSPSGQSFLPLIVLLGISKHGRFITDLRVQTDWNGWRGLSAEKRRAWISDELTVTAWESRDGTGVLTQNTVYRCVLSGARDERANSYIEMRWNPTTSLTEQTSLLIDRGQALVNQPNQWDEDYHQVVGIRTSELWDASPSQP